MPPGLALGLLASLGWGLVDVAAAVSTRLVGSLRVLAGTQAVSLAGVAVVAAVQPSLLGADPGAGLVAGFPLGFLAAAAYLAYFTALRIGPVSIVSPVIMAYGGATVVLAVVLCTTIVALPASFPVSSTTYTFSATSVPGAGFPSGPVTATRSEVWAPGSSDGEAGSTATFRVR